MNPYRLILNPAAGHGNGQRVQGAIEAALARCGIQYDLSCTERPGHALELARQAAQDGAEVVIAAGGDGTLNEVVNGLMQAREAGVKMPAVGVLCAGRGNDFAGSVGIPADFEAACQLLKGRAARPIDIGRVRGGIYPDGRYFINVVGVGFDVIATIEAAKLPRWGGFMSFMVAIFKTIFLYNHAPVATITFDGQTLTQRSLMISMMNGRRLGGGFFIAPTSKQDDGLLDLCIAEQMSSLQVVALLPHFMKGTHVTQPRIKMRQAKTITITSHDGPLPAQTDGEIICTEGWELAVETLPRQIEVICPPPKD